MIFISLIIGIVTSMLFNGVYGVFASMLFVMFSMMKRRKEILELNLYLKQMNAGRTHYDISNYKEGELSILRSELSKTTLMLNTTNLKLLQQQEFLNQSLSDISHQLKTPITGLSLMNEILLDQVDRESRVFVRNAQIQVERLEWLIVSLLKLVQLEAKSISMDYEKIAIRQLVDNALSYSDNGKAIEIIGNSEVIVCDPKWTQEALINVLNNKFHYAASKITIELGSNRLNTFIRISDDGPEISMFERKTIFDRFVKGSNARNESVGIGLALSREIMIEQGFKIIIEDRNTFVFIFNDDNVTSKGA